MFHTKKGLFSISSLILVSGPWPGYTTVSGGRAKSLVRMFSISCSWSPPGRSDRPILPAKSASPVNTTPSS